MDNNYQQSNIFKEIDLCDKELICKYLQEEKFMISDISFGNIFIWRLARKIEFAIIHDCLVIQTTYPHQKPFIFFPIGQGDKKACLKELYKIYNNNGHALQIHSIEKTNINILYETFGKDISLYLNRDRSDYIYSTQNLIQLSGRKYHKKKNHLNRFFEEYNGFTFEEITNNNLPELKNTWKKWDIAQDDEGLRNESKGIINVFENYMQLNFKGGLLRFNDQIIAFSFGEIISNELCIIHIEKANTQYRGAYQAINQQLLKHCFASIQYVNREEDLGIEGLRKAKLSYNPEFILEKYETIIP